MIDIKFIRENPDIVKENIQKKFQDYKLPLVDEVIEFDKKSREATLKGEKGNYFAHTLNNTVVAPPRMLIALLENHYNPDGSVDIPEVLWPYMGGTKKLVP